MRSESVSAGFYQYTGWQT